MPLVRASRIRPAVYTDVDSCSAFYATVIEHALADFGDRISIQRATLRESDLHQMSELSREDLATGHRARPRTLRPIRRLGLVAPRPRIHFEHFRALPASIVADTRASRGRVSRSPSQDFFSALISTPRTLKDARTPARIRRLFLTPHHSLEAAPQAYFALVRSLRRSRRRSRAAAAGK